jgi:hypothetical protein
MSGVWQANTERTFYRFYKRIGEGVFKEEFRTSKKVL